MRSLIRPCPSRPLRLPALAPALVRALALAWAFLLVFAFAPSSGQEESAGAGSEDTPEIRERDWLESYYENPEPERFIENVKKWSAEGSLSDPHAIPALVAFMSRVLRENRESLRDWYEELAGLSPEEKQVFHTAMLYSRVSEADEILRETFGRRYDEQRVETPRILELPLDKEGTLDMLWGFFYASGSEHAIRRIVLCFRFVDAPENLEDVEIPEGYLPLYKVLPNYAFGSLVDNAQLHPRLVEILKTFLETRGDLLPIERQAVYDVLSEVDPEGHPPGDAPEPTEPQTRA